MTYMAQNHKIDFPLHSHFHGQWISMCWVSGVSEWTWGEGTHFPVMVNKVNLIESSRDKSLGMSVRNYTDSIN